MDHPRPADPGHHVILLFLDNDQPWNLAHDPSQYAHNARILGTCVQSASASPWARDAGLEISQDAIECRRQRGGRSIFPEKTGPAR